MFKLFKKNKKEKQYCYKISCNSTTEILKLLAKIRDGKELTFNDIFMAGEVYEYLDSLKAEEK